jgi:hypothetical protein
MPEHIFEGTKGSSLIYWCCALHFELENWELSCRAEWQLIGLNAVHMWS